MRMTTHPLGFEEIAKEVEKALICLDEGNTARAGILLHRLVSALTSKAPAPGQPSPLLVRLPPV